MSRQPLDKEVSLSEMMTLRESGMTNKEIAESLEVSQATVRKYIGIMPDGLRRQALKSCGNWSEKHGGRGRNTIVKPDTHAATSSLFRPTRTVREWQLDTVYISVEQTDTNESITIVSNGYTIPTMSKEEFLSLIDKCKDITTIVGWR